LNFFRFFVHLSRTYLLNISLACTLFFNSNIVAAQIEKIPIIWNLSIPNSYFVGRDYELSELYKIFLSNKNICVIVGSVAIGKTQLAKKFTELYKSEYDIVWWIDSSQNIDKQIYELATQLSKLNITGINKTDFLVNDKIILLQNVKEFFRITHYKWLLVFDNFDTGNDTKKYLPIRHNTKNIGHILITSRNSSNWSNMIKLSKFKRNESISLLNKILQYNSGDFDKFSDLLDDHPLALVQAASYIKSTPSMDIIKYINLFHKSYSQLFKRQEQMTINHKNINDNYDNTLQITVSVTLDNIKKSNSLAFEISEALAYMNNANLSDFLIHEIAKHLPNYKEDEFDAALGELTNYSIIEKENTGQYGINKIIQLIIRDTNKERSQKYIEICAKSLLQYLYTDINKAEEFLNIHNYIISHAENVVFIADSSNIQSLYITDLKLRLAEYYLIVNVNYEMTENILENLKLIKDITNLQKYYLNMASAVYQAWRNADYVKAIELSKIGEKNLVEYPEKQYEKLWLNNQLAQFYIYFGNVSEAKKHLIKAGKTLKENPDLSGKGLYNALSAKIDFDSGQYQLAYDKLNETLKHYNLENETNETPGFMEYYFLNYRILLKLGQASVIYNSIYKQASKLDKIYGKQDHSAKYYLLSIMADGAIKSGNLKVAQETLYNAELIVDRMCGDSAKEQEQGYFYTVKGEYYLLTKNYNDAFYAFLRAENIYNKIYQVRETDDISNTYTNLAILSIKMDDQKTAQHYLDLHRKNFGNEHKRSKMIITAMIESGMNVEF